MSVINTYMAIHTTVAADASVVQVVYRCACNQREYASKQALQQHQKTQGHRAWMERTELRQLKIELTEKTNVIVGLENKVRLLKELNNELLNRLTICD